MQYGIKIDNDAVYSRVTLAAALGLPYGRLFQAERRGEVAGPTFPVGRRLYYTPAERDAVAAWADIKRRAGAR